MTTNFPESSASLNLLIGFPFHTNGLAGKCQGESRSDGKQQTGLDRLHKCAFHQVTYWDGPASGALTLAISQREREIRGSPDLLF